MSCFSFFKHRSSKRSSSAPGIWQQSEVGTSSSTTNTTTSSVSAATPKRTVKSTGSAPSGRTLPEMFKEKEHNLRMFSYSEMKEATNRFDRMLKLGEGGFGSVYKGLIKPVDGIGEPSFVAIKKLNRNGLQVFLVHCCAKNKYLYMMEFR